MYGQRGGRAFRELERGEKAASEAEAVGAHLAVVRDVDERGDEETVRRTRQELAGTRCLERRENPLDDEEGGTRRQSGALARG